MTDEKVTQIDPTLTPDNIELENIYSSFKPSWSAMFGYAYGSKNRSKMIEFSRAYNVGNKVIDFYMAIPPAKQDYENVRSYKDRQVFQKALYKYRQEIYDFSKHIDKKTLNKVLEEKRKLKAS